MSSDKETDLSIPFDIGDVSVLLSGEIIATVSGQHIIIGSGGFPIGEVTVKSGEYLTIQQPLPVKVSGEVVSVASGVEINYRTDKLSGLQVINASGLQVIVQAPLVVKISGETLSIASGVEVISRPSNLSGQNVISNKDGEAIVLFSGYSTTNTVVYSGFGFLKHEAATILLTHLGDAGSGINYTIRGAVLSGAIQYSIVSGSIYSGDVVVETLSDPYSYVDVGIDSKQDTNSGQVTVTVVRR